MALAALCAIFQAHGCSGAVRDYSVRTIEKYPHDVTSYTQGLFFRGGVMYETTGEYGNSTLRRLDYKTGKPDVKLEFARKYFAEGSCCVDGKMYVLTWTNHVAFIYGIDSLNYLKTVSYPREGWGLASLPQERRDGAVMVASDGSPNLYFLDRNLKTVSTLKVTVDGNPLRLLNELEWIDGKIWANVYTTDMIVIINPESGRVEGRIDCSSLIPRNRRTASMDVLNGIAQDPAGNIYLTGKNWPWLFKVELVPLR